MRYAIIFTLVALSLILGSYYIDNWFLRAIVFMQGLGTGFFALVVWVHR